MTSIPLMEKYAKKEARLRSHTYNQTQRTLSLKTNLIVCKIIKYHIKMVQSRILSQKKKENPFFFNHMTDNVILLLMKSPMVLVREVEIIENIETFEV